jgi:hypothetical protein
MWSATKAYSSRRILTTTTATTTAVQRWNAARSFSSSSATTSSISSRTLVAATLTAAAATTVMLATTNPDSKRMLSSSSFIHSTTQLDAAAGANAAKTVAAALHECAAQKEPATGIFFDALCNGYTLVGTGVRVKYGLIKVYAVGTYIDNQAVASIKQDSAAIEKALLNIHVPRTIRIVMHRNLGIEKYTEAIVEALTPRMHGQDLDKLEEFKKLNPPIDLEKGTFCVVSSRIENTITVAFWECVRVCVWETLCCCAHTRLCSQFIYGAPVSLCVLTTTTITVCSIGAVMEMTIRGDTLLYKNAVGGYGSIHSAIFCQALLETYYGTDPVSPTHKASVVQGIRKL